jgi:hypothetical protein
MKDKQKQVRKIQHRYQKSIKGNTEKNGEDCHKNVNDETDKYVGLFLHHSWVERLGSSSGPRTAISFIHWIQQDD